ncbi:hypothetical protein SLEP1_g23035 [Rubroshorea leprosula]|uniref:Uncharacterized protein n=1 Tax=Rubroshorea leprosula TaxID=152421 RepID=A0AAV5JLH6_9ROSI|nr:hypothetical protein SLEP1_g23035 [Rubroshorea leprosula]
MEQIKQDHDNKIRKRRVGKEQKRCNKERRNGAQQARLSQQDQGGELGKRRAKWQGEAAMS